MKKEFENKRICFIGDSIIQHGFFLSYLRSRLYDTSPDKMPTIFNCGLGGNCSHMASDLLEDEVFSWNADYCFIHYGVNDLGGWLYDASAEVTEDIIIERKARDARFFNGMKETVKKLKENNVIPIIMSPYTVNELLEESGDIQTLEDNREKAEKLKAAFYRRENLRMINEKMKEYSETLKAYAQENGVLFLDLFSHTYDLMLSKGGLHAKDGVHLSMSGNEEFAKLLLRFLGEEDIPESLYISEKAEKIAEAEKAERGIQYVKWARFHPILGYQRARMKEYIDKTLCKDDLPLHFRQAIEAYLKYDGDVTAARKELLDAMEAQN